MTKHRQDPELHFVWLEVSALPRSVDFYRETLGFPVQDDAGAFAIVNLASSKLYLAPGQPLGMSMHIAVSIPDVDYMYRRLRSYHLNIASPVDESWARYISLIDPDGYRLLLLQLATVSSESNT